MPPAAGGTPAAGSQKSSINTATPTRFRGCITRRSSGWKLVAIWLLFLVWVQVGRLGQSRYARSTTSATANGTRFCSFRFSSCCCCSHFRSLSGSPTFGPILAAARLCIWRRYVPYVVTRNKSVELHQRVFTSDWFRYEFAQLASKVGIEDGARAQGRLRKGRAGRSDGHRRARRTRQPGQPHFGPPIAGLSVRERFDRRHGRSPQRQVHSRLHAAIGRRPAAHRRRMAQRRRPRPRIGRRHAGRDENARQSQRHRTPQKTGKQVRRQVQRPLVRLPDLQPGRADGRAGCRATAGWLPARVQELRRPGNATQDGRAVGRMYGIRARA